MAKLASEAGAEAEVLSTGIHQASQANRLLQAHAARLDQGLVSTQADLTAQVCLWGSNHAHSERLDRPTAPVVRATVSRHSTYFGPLVLPSACIALSA